MTAGLIQAQKGMLPILFLRLPRRLTTMLPTPRNDSMGLSLFKAFLSKPA
jgi:hypothetical protein